MSDEVSPAEAAQALTDIQLRQQQVIDLATIPVWYWWAVGALMVVLAVGVDLHSPVAIGLTVPVFVVGMLAAAGWVVSPISVTPLSCRTRPCPSSSPRWNRPVTPRYARGSSASGRGPRPGSPFRGVPRSSSTWPRFSKSSSAPAPRSCPQADRPGSARGWPARSRASCPAQIPPRTAQARSCREVPGPEPDASARTGTRRERPDRNPTRAPGPEPDASARTGTGASARARSRGGPPGAASAVG
jgi:hypothetical protein